MREIEIATVALGLEPILEGIEARMLMLLAAKYGAPFDSK
jgi:hypothetical protein